MSKQQSATVATAEAKPGCASVNGSAAVSKCEWCETPHNAIRASGMTSPGIRQAIGWCEKCATWTWSKPIKCEAPPNVKLTNPAAE